MLFLVKTNSIYNLGDIKDYPEISVPYNIESNSAAEVDSSPMNGSISLFEETIVEDEMNAFYDSVTSPNLP